MSCSALVSFPLFLSPSLRPVLYGVHVFVSLHRRFSHTDYSDVWPSLIFSLKFRVY